MLSPWDSKEIIWPLWTSFGNGDRITGREHVSVWQTLFQGLVHWSIKMRHFLHFWLKPSWWPLVSLLCSSESVVISLQRSHLIPIPPIWVYVPHCPNDDSWVRGFIAWPRPHSHGEWLKEDSNPGLPKSKVSGNALSLSEVPRIYVSFWECLGLLVVCLLFRFLTVCFAHNCAVWKHWLIPKQGRAEYQTCLSYTALGHLCWLQRNFVIKALW